MAPGKRVPGERLAGRLSTRLRRAEGLLVAGRLSERLAQRVAGPAASGGTFAARLDRWSSSPMLAWARGVHGGPSSLRWGLMGPELVLAWPELEPAAEAEPGSPAARTRRRASSAEARRSTTRGRRQRDLHVSVPPASSESRIPVSSELSAAGRPSLSASAPVPARRRPVGLQPALGGAAPSSKPSPRHRHAVFSRAASRDNPAGSPAPLRSHWASRQHAPPAPPHAARHRDARRVPAASTSSAPPRFARSAPEAVLETGVPGSRESASFDSAARDFVAGPAPGRRAQRRPAPHGALAGAQPPRSDASSRPPRRALGSLWERTEPAPLLAARQRVEAAGGSMDPAIESSLPDAAPAGRVFRALADHPARAVITALARAGTQERAARIAVAHADQLAASSNLPGPLGDVVREIGQQIRQAASKAQAAPSRGAASAAARPSAAQGRAQREMERVVGSSGSAPVVSLASQRLVRRLQNLVHLAEVDRRKLEAQRNVRMAEDSAQARAEGSASPDAAASGEAPPVDLDALRREVLSAVTSIRDSRTIRRSEDPDVRIDVY